MKSVRQNVILEIISTQEIETQNQLMQALNERGISSTQATLSRDIKELRLVKELSGGRYRYSVPSQASSPEHSERLRKIFREGVISCDTAMNLIVLKTLPGLAQAASSAMDSMDIPGMVGSLAGDDTGILIMRDGASAQQFSSEVHKRLR